MSDEMPGIDLSNNDLVAPSIGTDEVVAGVHPRGSASRMTASQRANPSFTSHSARGTTTGR